MNQLFDIENKVIAVTGATGVLAGGAARYFLEQGARVAFLSRSKDRIDAALSELGECGDRALGAPCDVLDRGAVESARDAILDRFGRIDALVNGAGGNMPGATVGPDADLAELSLEDYGRVVDLNLKGTLIPILAFSSAFAESRTGSIINFSSMAADRPLTRVVGYANAKAAVENLTRWMAVELAKRCGDGVRVNAVAPGFFVGKQNRALLLNEDGSPTDRGRQILAATPFGRFGRTEELYGILHYLAGDASSFTTGCVFPVDGGFSAYSGV